MVLEIGSGPGQHAAHFAAGLSPLRWLPSDPENTHLHSIEAWRAAAAGAAPEPALRLDATTDWAEMPELTTHAPVTAVYSQNVIHIAPWAVAQGIVSGAARVLAPGGLLIFYGPFKQGGVHTGPGNAAFDAALRTRDARWGVRDLDAVATLARSAEFELAEIAPMPSDNRLALFRRLG